MEENQYINNLIKLSEFKLTNTELILLTKSNVKYSVDQCAIKLNNKDKTKAISEFLACLGPIVCPNECLAFKNCIKEPHKKLNDCINQLQLLTKSLTQKVNESIYEIDNIKL